MVSVLFCVCFNKWSSGPSEKKTKVSMGDKEVGIPFKCIMFTMIDL